MKETPFRSADEVTPAALTALLRGSDLLPEGEVIGLEKDCRSPFGAEVCTLSLTYSPDAPPTLPRRLFIKLVSGGGPIDERGRREIAFYQSMMKEASDLPVPRAYHAAYDPESGAMSLLLEDLSDRYDMLPHELPPTVKQGYKVMEVLARTHAHWWGKADLSGLAPPRTEDSLREEFNEDVKLYRGLADLLGDRLLPSRRAIFDQVIEASLPLRLDRFARSDSLTLVHGDAHAWNFMYPRSESDLPLLLDWEALGINLPPFDAAYLMTVFWDQSRRAQLEEPLLRHYHDQLIRQGVKGYSWADCWHDYRLAVISLVFEPAWWWKFNLPAFLWWYRLERIMLAFEDLDCASLLG